MGPVNLSTVRREVVHSSEVKAAIGESIAIFDALESVLYREVVYMVFFIRIYSPLIEVSLYIIIILPLPPVLIVLIKYAVHSGLWRILRWIIIACIP